jgi:hypothetical protein
MGKHYLLGPMSGRCSRPMAMEMVYIGPWTRHLNPNHQANDYHDARFDSRTQGVMRVIAIAVRSCQRSSQYVPVVLTTFQVILPTKMVFSMGGGHREG